MGRTTSFASRKESCASGETQMAWMNCPAEVSNSLVCLKPKWRLREGAARAAALRRSMMA
jgi:hypothetical protein